MNEEREQIIQIMPPGPWWVRWHHFDGRVVHDYPLVGWALAKSGDIHPIAKYDDEVRVVNIYDHDHWAPGMHYTERDEDTYELYIPEA